jgi:hypothetical protein
MMKKLILILFSVLLFSCSNSKKDIRPFDSSGLFDNKPHDTFSSAANVSNQSQIIGFFNNKGNAGERDYYKVNFSNNGIGYKVVLTAVPGIDSRVTFYSRNKERILSVDNGGMGEAEKIWEYYPKDDFIFVIVEAKAGFNEKVPYVLEFIPLQGEDNYGMETNNDKDHAAEIRINDEKKGLISPDQQANYYKIVFNDSQVHDFSIELETMSNHDFAFTIINDQDEKNERVKFINNFGWGEKESYPFLASNKGKYFIKVTANLKPNDNTIPAFTIKLKDASSYFNGNSSNLLYEREFNDDKDHATDLNSGKTIVGTLFPANDEDWFKFDMNGFYKTADLSLSRIRNINTKIEVYNSGMSLVNSSSGKQDETNELLLTNLPRGTYYVKITGDDKSLEVYNLLFTTKY